MKQIAANPFTPRFGKVPPHMAGRRDIIEPLLEAFEGSLNSPDLTSIFVGARGTGKTAMLSYLGIEAQQRGWISVDVTAVPGMLEDIYQQAVSASEHIVQPPATKRVNQIRVSGLGGVGWENDPHDENWRTRMGALLDELAKVDIGLLITVDEADPEIDDMIQLVVTYQHFVRENRKVALLMAGLPSNVSSLVSGKRTSYLRRASQHDLGSIPDYEVEEAFRLTVTDGGKAIGQPALDAAVNAIGGFPFMFQLVGYRAWNASGSSESISDEDVSHGVKLAKDELKAKVFDATYAELSAGDRAFLNAMLQDDDVTLQQDLPGRMGKTSSYVSNYKKRLLRQGVIEEFPKGTLRFSLPGFRDYLG